MRVNTPLSLFLALSECEGEPWAIAVASQPLPATWLGLRTQTEQGQDEWGAMTAFIVQFALPLKSCLSVLALLFYSALALVTVGG